MTTVPASAIVKFHRLSEEARRLNLATRDVGQRHLEARDALAICRRNLDRLIASRSTTAVFRRSVAGQTGAVARQTEDEHQRAVTSAETAVAEALAEATRLAGEHAALEQRWQVQAQLVGRIGEYLRQHHALRPEPDHSFVVTGQ